MKKHFILQLVIIVSLLIGTSCNFLEDYLDKAPESGLTEDVVFTKYANFKSFFDALYFGQKYYSGSWRGSWNYQITCPLYIDLWDQKYCINSTTDACDQGRYMEGQAWKSGNMSETIVSKLCYDGARRPILGACFDDIRICNIAIRNVDRIQDCTQDIKNDFLGQAYFLRALYHFTLFRFWGPMPYLDYVMGPYDETWDLARMEKNDFLQRCVQDWDSAYYYFDLCDKIRRDPVGSLAYSTYEMYRPNGMAAKAYKSRALLYAASPLNNKNGAADWQAAAAAAWDAIKVAEENGVILLPLKDPVAGLDRHQNYYDKSVCAESIWTRDMGTRVWDWGGGSGEVATMWGGHFMAHSSASGINPTQNFVDKYETADGYPLNTPAERAIAIAAGSYADNRIFANRDPRFYEDIIYNGSPAQGWGGGTANSSKFVPANTAPIYMYGTTPSDLLTTAYNGRSYTGYAMRKYWKQNSAKNQGVSTIWADVLFRLSELYLNYGEAVNEAYGPTGTAPGSSMTALAAINIIRTKSGMPNVRAEFTADKNALRPRIQNERNIELAWEGQHYYDDVRRWAQLPQVMAGPVYAIIPQQTSDLVNYPDGFVYTRTLLPADRQPAWEEGMYYLPFLNSDALKMKNFVANPVW